MSRGGDEAAFQVSVWPSRTTGVFLGSLEKRTLPIEALVLMLAVIENYFFLDGGRFLKLRIPKCNNVSFPLYV